MHSKNDLLNNLEASGLKPQDTILIHSSMKSIGEVSGGADTVLDALEEYFSPGLLVFPTLTWKIGYPLTPEAGTVFSVKDSPTDVGILAELFRKRPGVIRSLHPTHSVAAKGGRAAEFTARHEYAKTTLDWDSPWGRLYEWNAKILFLGVSLGCNTYLHAVEEKFPVPGLLDNILHPLTVIDENGRRILCSIMRHVGEHSHQYHLARPLFEKAGVLHTAKIGDAVCNILDAHGAADAVWNLLKKKPAFFSEEYQRKYGPEL